MTNTPAPIQTGNMQLDTTDTRGWLVGNFIDKQLGLRHSDDVEIKWGVHLAGTAREEWVTGETRTSIGILISGSFELEFIDRRELPSPSPATTLCGGQVRTISGAPQLTVSG